MFLYFSFWQKTLSTLRNSSLYANLPSFLSPYLITGDSHRPDLVFVTEDRTLYMLELTIGFESNIVENITRKAKKNSDLIKELSPAYKHVIFDNLSMSALDILGTSSTSLLDMLDQLNFDSNQTKSILMKLMNISIRCTYSIFCRRSKP